MLEGINGLGGINGNQKSQRTAQSAGQESLNSVFGTGSSKVSEGQNDLKPISLGSRVKKVVTTINDDGSKTEKSYDKDGKLTKEVVYKDVNVDGKEDIYSVTNFYEAYDDPVEEGKRHPATSISFIDEDGDGYYDSRIEKEYDENGKLKTETKSYEEDINDVKNRDHMPWEIHNRRMDAHKSGVLMM